jgi:thiol-disulfide isomerase/thioredoxin
MANFISNYLNNLNIYIQSLLLDKFNILFVLIIFIIFFIVLYFTYYKLVKPNIKKNLLNKEFINKEAKNDNIIIIFFKTEWCPYCKASMSEWNKFEEYIKNYYNKDNKIIVKTIIVDCDDKPDLADKYEVKGYPTIKLIYKGDIYDYDAKPEFNSLKQFLNTTV